MSDADAAAVVAAARAQGKLAALENIESLYRAIPQDTTDTRVSGGLISQEDADGSPYKLYAPLRGFEAEDIDSSNIPKDIHRARAGRGFNIRGREDKRAFGRQSKAGNILAHTILQNTESVIRSEKNKVAQAFLEMVRQNEDLVVNGEPLAKVVATVPLGLVLNSRTGRIQYAPRANYKDDPNILTVKEDGKEIAIEVSDPRVARAMKMDFGIGSGTGGQLLNAMSQLNRWLANVNTAWSPEFVISNLAKDLQTAGVVAQQYNIEGFSKAIIGDVRNALAGIEMALNEASTSDTGVVGVLTGGFRGASPVRRAAMVGEDKARIWANRFTEFRKSGGTTEFLGIRDLDSQIKRIQRELSDLDPGKLHSVRKAVDALAGFMQDYNKVAENAVRLSAFHHARENGMSVDQAASLAKNLTVNFNRGGEFKTLANALYLFYNASLQGSLVLMNAARRSKKVRRILGGLVGVGLVTDMVNRMMSDDDEDGKKLYDKIPNYVLEHNWVVMMPGIGKGYIKFPMPYGLNAFVNVGRNLGKFAAGEAGAGDAVKSMLFTGFDAFNPIGGTESFINLVSPTFADPMVDLYENENFAGQPIIPSANPFLPDALQKPASERYWSSTAMPYVKVSEWLNTLTGGNEIRSGDLSVSPETLEHWFDFVTGSAGKFVMRSYENITDEFPSILTDDIENLEIGNIVFARKLIGNITNRNNVEAYYKNSGDVLLAKKELDHFTETHDPLEARRVRVEYRKQLSMEPLAKKTEKKLQKLREQLREVRNNKFIPAHARDARVDAIKARMDREVNNFNRVYYRVMS